MKHYKLLTACCILLTACFAVACTSQQPWSVRMADSEMTRYPKAVNLDFREKLKWDYTFGLEGLAFVQLSEKTGERKYFDYIEAYTDTMINEAGEITTYKLSNYNIDHLNPGKMLFPIYEKTQKEKYKKALVMLRDQINTHPRTNEGGFWHKKIYPYQMWLDGLYMGAPFYAECIQRFNEPDSLYDDVINQFVYVARHTFDQATGLFRHAWDESREQAWADKETGQASQVWGRAMGWYAMALVDVLDFIPAQHPRRDTIMDILQVVVRGVRQYQDTTGVWWQVMDKGGKEGNYLEATASSMFVYALLKAVNHNYIDNSYLAVAKKGYEGILNQFIVVDEQGLVNLTSCCSVAGLGGNPYRPGTYEYYLSEPIRDNDPKGVGPFIMASMLYEDLKK